jgi:hypothetical protein
MKIDVFVSESCHELVGLISRTEFMCEKINELLAVLGFPIKGAEEGNEIIFQ